MHRDKGGHATAAAVIVLQQWLHTPVFFFLPRPFNKQTAASDSASVPHKSVESVLRFSFFFFFQRPGCCAGEGSAAAYKSSTTFPDDTLTFIKSYPLMDEAVPSVNHRPFFTRTTSRYRDHSHWKMIKMITFILRLLLAD